MNQMKKKNTCREKIFSNVFRSQNSVLLYSKVYSAFTVDSFKIYGVISPGNHKRSQRSHNLD